MHRRFAAALLVVSVASADAAEDALRARLGGLCDGIGGAQVGVQVVDVDTGRVVFARDADRLLVPASNMKILTSAAALARLMPQYRFRTTLHGDRVEGERVVGSLYLRGFGDPTLHSEHLAMLASDLRALGVRRVTRDVVVDDAFFDAERFPPGYVGPGGPPPDDDAPYRAPVGAVSLNFNSVRVIVRATAEGQPAVVAAEPASAYARVVGRVDTVAAGASRVWVQATPGDAKLVLAVGGQIRAGAEPREFRKRVEHPDLYAGETLRTLLARFGVHVNGRVRRGATPAGAVLLADHSSEPLGVIVRELNKFSQNFMAEQTLKTLGAEARGAPGTTAKGLDVVGEWLESVGIARGGYTLENGSGMGRGARLTAAQITAVLRAAWRDFRVASDFVASLAVAGADGTLGARMVGTAAERFVRAKTGTLTGVAALSGYAGGSRAPLAFAVLVGGADGKRLADAIATELAAFVKRD